MLQYKMFISCFTWTFTDENGKTFNIYRDRKSQIIGISDDPIPNKGFICCVDTEQVISLKDYDQGICLSNYPEEWWDNLYCLITGNKIVKFLTEEEFFEVHEEKIQKEIESFIKQS